MTTFTAESLMKKWEHHFKGPRYIECGEGWLTLIDKFCEELDRIEGGKELTFFCIKEKWGLLRIDFNEGYTNEVYLLESKYEKLSASICERCGEPGLRRMGGWIQVLCDKHNKEK